VSRPLSIAIFALTAAFFGVFFILPIGVTVKSAFVLDGEFTFSYVLAVFQNPIYLEGLVNSFKMGLFSTLLSLAIALPLALIANHYRFPGKEILSSLILVCDPVSVEF